MIDILIPVLSRPHNAAPLVDSIRATTKLAYNIVFLCSPGDDEQIEACRMTKAKVKVVPWQLDRSDYPKKMNFGYRSTRGKYVLLGADDLTFHEDWDVKVVEMAETTKAGVIGTNDCANRQVMRGQFSTHALVRRSYIQKLGASLDGPGTLISESYDHNYCDRELCHLAQSRSLWAFAADSHIKHRHPVWRTAKDDATYAKARLTMKEDHTNFYLRSAQWGHTGILPQEQKWLNKAERRQRRMTRGKVRD